MPTYQDPLHGVELAVALAEAASFAPTDVVVLDTVEITHPSGASIYMVADYSEWTANLESGASVIFSPVAFSDELPVQSDEGTVTLSLTIFGVSLPALEMIIDASQTLVPVTVNFRQYASNDPSGPLSRAPMSFELVEVPYVGPTSIQLKCAYGSSNSRGFPRKHYTLSEYPTLVG